MLNPREIVIVFIHCDVQCVTSSYSEVFLYIDVKAHFEGEIYAFFEK